jgi:hypothetical protein
MDNDTILIIVSVATLVIVSLIMASNARQLGIEQGRKQSRVGESDLRAIIRAARSELSTDEIVMIIKSELKTNGEYPKN